jgi:tRNA A-37 threonylcarbamoyl transferase component Bud32
MPARAPEGLCPKCLLLGVAAPTEFGASQARPAAPTLDAVGAAFPHLQILELIGQGGMGCVFKARQPQLNRFVALKILPESLAQDVAFAARFAREALALAALSHPSIVTVHDSGQSGGFFYLLMEFVDGANLRQALRAGRFTPEQALAIVPPICDALQFAHEHGIVHRDIKPENVLLDKAGRVKIADFGIAKMVGAAPLAADERAAGTPHYVAPEQKDHPQQTDHRADIYSLGVVLYEMLTGELPSRQLEPPSSRIRGMQIDVRLDEVVLRALEKSPELRWQTAAELRSQVETIASSSEMGSTAAPAPPVGASPGGTVRDPRALLNTHFRRSFKGVLLLSLPSALFAWFVLVGHRRSFGMDLDADVQLWTGLVGFPLSAGFGTLLAWLTGAFSESNEVAAMEKSRRWSDRTIVAALLLGVSVLLMGGGMVLLALGSQDSAWNPSAGELIFVLIFSGGGLLTATSATLVGWSARTQIRREPYKLRGWGGAFAASWFWPGVAVGFLVLSLPVLIGAPRRQVSSLPPVASRTQNLSFNPGIERSAMPDQSVNSSPPATLESLPPVVVRTEPASGARDVSPGIVEVRVKFSKEMTEGSWSWTTAWADSTPEVVDAPRYDPDRRTCVLKAKLEPGRTYAWWLNSGKHQNFKDKGGNPAVPYLLIFRTRGEEGSP